MDNDWATPTIKDVPFWRDDITPEEYDTERIYFYQNFDSYKNGTYIPLWQQKTPDGL